MWIKLSLHNWACRSTDLLCGISSLAPDATATDTLKIMITLDPLPLLTHKLQFNQPEPLATPYTTPPKY